MAARIEPITGRYLHLEIDGRPHRVYFEEAGQGIPLLCLHTAGSDGRQYRAIMNDPEITRHFRVIAYDMPWHGKSSPPEGWRNEEYKLTSKSYVTQIVAVADALGLERPVAMGCSIGGRIVLYLAHQHPERFRAIIGLESAAHVAPYYDVEWLHRGDVHGGEVSAGVVSGLVAPTAPDHHRWETLWHYLMSGPGVFKGDLYFYKVDGDIRAKIDLVRRELPEDVESPVVQKFDPSSQPILSLALSSDQVPVSELTLFADGVLRRRLEAVNGVGQVQIAGGLLREVRVYLEPDRMQALGVSAPERM